MFAAWGRIVYRSRWVVLAASVLSIAAVIFSMQYGGRLGTGEFSATEGTESGRVDDLLNEKVAKTPPSFMLIFGNEEENATDKAFREGVERALKPLEDTRGSRTSVPPTKTAPSTKRWSPETSTTASP